MTLEERQHYVDVIKALYKTSISVDESQISDEVADIVDTILYEIRNCTMNLGIFISIVDGVTAGMKDVLESLGFGTPSSQRSLIEETLKDKTKAWLKSKAEIFGWGFIKGVVESWIKILDNNTASLACKNSALLSYKSPLAIALLGL